jgi:hypothetical protein
MSAGPHLIFDKSALQCLSLDETNWLDNFFYTVVTPLFFAETLADLEREVGKGKTPEQIVSSLAIKTPDMQSTPCPHHHKLLASVLYGQSLPLDGRIPRDQGQVVELDGKKGILYSKSPEEEALDRWYKGEFRDVERQFAKKWRRQLRNKPRRGVCVLPKVVSDGQTEHAHGSEVAHGRLHRFVSPERFVEIRIEYARCSRIGPR